MAGRSRGGICDTVLAFAVVGIDTERGLNQGEWRPVGSPFDIGAPLGMTLNATRKNVAKGLASMTRGRYQLFGFPKEF